MVENRVIHFEIYSDNPEKDAELYRNAFGWKIEKWQEGDYWLVMTGEKDSKSPGINGGIGKREKTFDSDIMSNVFVVGVENIDKAIEKALKAGARIFREKIEIPKVGKVAYFKDFSNNILGIIEPEPM